MASAASSHTSEEPQILATFRIDATVGFPLVGGTVTSPFSFVSHAYLFKRQRRRMLAAAHALAYDAVVQLLADRWYAFCEAIQMYLLRAFDRQVPAEPIRVSALSLLLMIVRGKLTDEISSASASTRTPSGPSSTPSSRVSPRGSSLTSRSASSPS